MGFNYLAYKMHIADQEDIKNVIKKSCYVNHVSARNIVSELGVNCDLEKCEIIECSPIIFDQFDEAGFDQHDYFLDVELMFDGKSIHFSILDEDCFDLQSLNSLVKMKYGEPIFDQSVNFT